MTAEKAEHYFSKDDYYLSAPGRWRGKGAEALGLAPGTTVEREAFRRIAMGRDPQTGEQVIGAGVNGKHRAGYDLTFSAPKSVSILSLRDPRIRDAHARAVDQALKLTEERYAAARSSVNGKSQQVRTGNLLIARFDHMVSRELDPQLHTHAFVSNITRRADGKLVAIESRPLFEVQLFLGAMYRSELARELEKLGYQIEVTSRAHGLIEIAGVPPELIEEFSKRRKQVEERVKEMEAKGEYASLTRAQRYEIAALGTRKAKESVSKNELVERWTGTIREHGHSLDSVREAAIAAGRTHEMPPGGAISAVEAARLGAEAVTSKESVFRREDVERAALRFSIGQHDHAAVTQAFDRLAAQGEIVLLGQDSRGREAWTTPEMQSIERGILEAAKAGKGKAEAIDAGAVEAHLAARSAEGLKLTADQEAAVRVICGSIDTDSLIQGDAGTGKTTMLNEVRDIHEQKNWDVVGVGFTGKAAKELERGAGIQSRTIDSFLASPPEAKGRILLVMDESSMTDSRRFSDVVRWANENGAKLVAVGDKKQFQAIGPGRMFEVLQREGVRCVEMKENVRQQTKHTKEAAEAMAKGDLEKAWDALESRGKIVEIADREGRLSTIKDAYLAARGAGKNTLVLTHLNEDRRDLNDRIREALVQRGEVERGRKFEVYELAAGLDPATARFSDAYRAGQVLSLHSEVVGRDSEQKAVPLSPGARLEVAGRDGDRLLVQAKSGARYSLNPVSSSDRWTVLEKREVELGGDDRVVFLKNDRKLKVENGTTGRVEKIDEHGNVRVRTDEGRTVKFNLSGLGEKQYNHLIHGYALTEHKSQGQTSDQVIWHANPGDVTRNAAYVSSTRGREDTLIVTSDKESLREAMKEAQEKTSTLDHYRERDGGEGTDRKGGWETGRGESRDQGRWAEGRESRYDGVDAQIYGKTLEEIRRDERNGETQEYYRTRQGAARIQYTDRLNKETGRWEPVREKTGVEKSDHGRGTAKEDRDQGRDRESGQAGKKGGERDRAEDQDRGRQTKAEHQSEREDSKGRGETGKEAGDDRGQERGGDKGEGRDREQENDQSKGREGGAHQGQNPENDRQNRDQGEKGTEARENQGRDPGQDGKEPERQPERERGGKGESRDRGQDKDHVRGDEGQKPAMAKEPEREMEMER